MKRLIMICLMGWMCLAALMAQEATHDIKGVVTDKQQQPIVGALVTVQGTEISTVTDIDGKFLLREVPVSAKLLVVESIGMETEEWEINTPIQVAPKRRKLSFVASAGAVMSRYTVNGGSFKMGYEFGLGIEVRMSKRMAFRPMLQLTTRGTVYKLNEEGFDFKETWSPVMLDLPMYFVSRYKLAYKTNLVFSFGPVLSYGFGGKVKIEENGEEWKGNIYSDDYEYTYGGKHALLFPFSFGVAYGLGIEYKKLMIGAWGKNMALPTDDEGISMDPLEHNWALTFGVAYRF